jgi:aminoacrylate hydrolase
VFGYTPAYMDSHEAELDKAAALAATALTPLTVTAARVRMLLDFDRSADLSQIRQPTLVIGARDDALIPIHHARRLRTLMPHAEHCEMEGAHFHPRTDPAPFAERVGRFLAATSDGATP